MTTTTVIYDPVEGIGTLADVREGDHVEMEVQVDDEWRAVNGSAFTRPEDSSLRVGRDAIRWADGALAVDTLVLRATREVPPMPPMPTTPGDVIRATVRGVPGVRVFYSPAGGAVAPWFSAVPVKGRFWHKPEDITAWEPIAVQRVHNHGTEDGPGLACNARVLPDGQFRGACLADDGSEVTR